MRRDLLIRSILKKVVKMYKYCVRLKRSGGDRVLDFLVTLIGVILNVFPFFLTHMLKYALGFPV
jgi:hypothetical protein